MPANSGAGRPPDLNLYDGRGWQPERTYCTPRCDSPGRSARGPDSYGSAPSVQQQRRKLDAGADYLSGQFDPHAKLGHAHPPAGGARWDWNGPAPGWMHSGEGIHEGYTPRSRSVPPQRAVAPHRRPPREVAGKVTGEPTLHENHRALDGDRTVAPYRRNPSITGKVSQTIHPAHRPGMREALYGPAAGVGSKDLAEHEVQSLFCAAGDVDRPAAKTVQAAQHASNISNDGLKPREDHSKEGWHQAMQKNRAFDGAFGASSKAFNDIASKQELGKQIKIRGREAHEPTVGKVVFNESNAYRQELVRAAEHVGAGGGGAYVKEQGVFEGSAGLTTHDHTAVRQREKWAKAGASQPKGQMQPGSVFDAREGGIVYGGMGDRPPSSPSAAADAKQREYYNQNGLRGAAGVKTMHQNGLSTASEATIRRSTSAPRLRPGGVENHPANEVGSGLGHHTKPVKADAYDGAFGNTTRMINSTMPELKYSLLAEGAMRTSAESAEAAARNDQERQYRFNDDVRSVVFGADEPSMPKQKEVDELFQRGSAGSDTHLINKRDLNCRYHDAGRYGRYGRGKTPAADGNTATINQHLFSAPKPKDFEIGSDGMHRRLEGGANKRFEGAAGASSSAVAEMEPLMRYRSVADQTDRQRKTLEANAASKRELNAAPEVEEVVFARSAGDVSRLPPRAVGSGHASNDVDLAAARGSPRVQGVAAAGSRLDRLASPRHSSPARGVSPARGSATMTSAQRFAQRQTLHASDAPAAGTSTHELSQKEPLLGGPAGPDHAVRPARIPGEAQPTLDEARELLHAHDLIGKPPNQTQQLRSQKAYVKAAGASTQEIEQQLHDLPVDRNKQLGGREEAQAALRGATQSPTRRPGASNPHNRLFDRAASPRGGKGAAGMATGKLAERDPYFTTDNMDSGLKMCAMHAESFGEVVFGRKITGSQRKHGDVELEKAPEFQGRLGIPSSKYNARDPIVVGDCPPGIESKAATTWKSQVDEVLYGVDLDGSGDYRQMHKEVEATRKGAAGVSTLKHAYDDPDFKVEFNTRIDTTYARPERDPSGKPIMDPIRSKKVNYGTPELFSKAGVANWVNHERGRGEHAGKDELWKPGVKEPPPRTYSSDMNFGVGGQPAFGGDYRSG